MIEQYLTERENLVAIIQLVDIRHPPSKEDRQMFEWLKAYQKQIIVACTKADKISRGRWPQHLKIIKQELQVRKQDVVLPCSAVDATGLEELRKIIEDLIKQKAPKT